MASPDGPSAAGRDEGTPHSGAGRAGSRTPGLLRGGRNPLSAKARLNDLKLPIAWAGETRSVQARCKA